MDCDCVSLTSDMRRHAFPGAPARGRRASTSPVVVDLGHVRLDAVFMQHPSPRGVIILAHGACGRIRKQRGASFAQSFHDVGFTTLAVDLFSRRELSAIARTGAPRCDFGLLAARLVAVTDLIVADLTIGDVPVGYCCEGVTAAAAAIAAAAFGSRISAITMRDPRMDLARPFLRFINAPTRAVIGPGDDGALDRSRKALGLIPVENDVMYVGSTVEPRQEYGDIDRVARALREWFERHVGRRLWAVGGCFPIA